MAGGGVKLTKKDYDQKNVTTFNVKTAEEAEAKIEKIKEGCQSKNKMERMKANFFIMVLKKKAKELRKTERESIRKKHGEEACPKQEPKTIESMRVPEPTFEENMTQEELEAEKEDETQDYFMQKYRPRVLISMPNYPSSETYRFCKELRNCIPRSRMMKRKAVPLHKLCKKAKQRGYTDILDVFVPRKGKLPTSMIYCHLPEGPSIHFRLTSITFMGAIPDRFPHAHRSNPELILTNFRTSQGRKLARLFAILFPRNPQFKKCQTVVFHNQRDFIFFRRYKYAFRENGEDVTLKEVGPRFTLKARRILQGIPSRENDDIQYEYNPHKFVKNKKKFAN